MFRSGYSVQKCLEKVIQPMKKRKVLIILTVLAGISIGICIGCFHADGAKYDYSDAAGGFWYAPGYGVIIEIVNDRAYYYEETEVSLIKCDLSLFDLSGFYFKMTGEDTARVGVKNTSWNYELRRMGNLPVDKLYTSQTDDYSINFEVLWHTFDELYAFFEKRGVCWEDIYQTYSCRAEKCTSDEEFYQLITEMLDVINDNHIMLYTSSKDSGWHDDDVVDIDWLSMKDVENTLNEIIKSNRLFYFPKKTAGEIFEEGLWGEYTSVIKEKYLFGEFISCCNDIIFYGKTDENTGYICVLKEDYFTGNQGDAPDDGLALLNIELDAMAQYFEGVDKIIVDTRFNWGGTDTYSLAIASRFAETDDVAFYQAAHYENKTVNKQTFYYDTEDVVPFNAEEVIVLSSRVTLSAGECLVMYLGNLDNTTVIGERTMGIWSNTLIRTLPNGWQFTLSNESVYDPKGVCYEAKGYPPDIEKPFTHSLFSEGVDSILEKALANDRIE